MKKHLAILLVLFLFVFCGCQNSADNTDRNRTDYIINDNDEIIIGVIAPKTGDNSSVGNDIISGVEFANNMASAVNIDKRYQIRLLVCDIEEDITKNAEKLIAEKASAVICYGTDFEKTNSIIDAFKESTTPLIFTDCYSDSIEENSTSITMSAPSNYKASVLASFISGDGCKNGTVIYENNTYSEAFAENFISLLKDTYGVSSGMVAYDKNLNLSTTLANSDFVFVVGNNGLSTQIAKSVKKSNNNIPVYMTEMYRSQNFEDMLFNNTFFLSKFEADEENHYVTDFINVYSNVKEVGKSEVSSAIAYGYDAYMIIYGALGSLNPNSSSNPLDSVKNNANKEDQTIAINASQVFDAIVNDGKVYGGPIDTIVFEDNGTFKPSYIFVDGVQNGSPYMINKFVY